MAGQHARVMRMLEYFASRPAGQEEPLWLPELWNECGYEDVLERKEGEIRVDPADFLQKHLRYLLELSLQHGPARETDLDKSMIYCALPRYSAAWDYDHSGGIQSGTFLRFMILLPLLKRMDVNILYLLPVTRPSDLNRKGDLGSPYAVYSLYELDPKLHDPLLDEMNGLTLDEELATLVEACHLLGMKVVFDFIPRVSARDNSFLAEHPEWFYWIDTRALEGFRPPEIEGLDFFTECTPDKLETVYASPETRRFLTFFRRPPHELNPDLWNELKERSRLTGEPLLRLAEAEMGVTTAPAHSDWINDVQPIWTDVAFFRLFEDPSPLVLPYLSEDQAPYALFDTIKCNLYPGSKPNESLWEMLTEAAAFQMRTYGIDGFRIDIGHTLPVPLLQDIFRTIRGHAPDAILISEDLFNRNHREAARTGYNVMLGSGWNVMSDIRIERLRDYVQELPELQLHVFACSETADTPRITSRGGKPLSRLMTVFNYFLPNGIPYLTTGMEVFEEQPLNCGLADNTDGADIPRAFFNTMKINWLSPATLLPLLEELGQIKRRYVSLLQPANFYMPDAQDQILIYSYYAGDELFCACFNLNPEEESILRTRRIGPGLSRTELLLESDAGELRTDGDGEEIYVMRPYQAALLMIRLVPKIREEGEESIEQFQEYRHEADRCLA
ncbi:alpha-amylase [Paenibacillus spiritus]|uniref:Alpha-amylase n=1 Tax=Paenibacillus spiritus TaxID=2496557 RepID=A0A5J5GM02_9BACL|nr:MULTISPECIES: alpha-amylase [Paenibacillus]KAA9008512.1 alpha-amylase [Paenibacillus spiritus]